MRRAPRPCIETDRRGPRCGGRASRARRAPPPQLRALGRTRARRRRRRLPSCLDDPQPAPAIGPRPETVADLARIARVEHDRIEPETAEAAEQFVETTLVRTCAFACFVRGHPHVLHATARRVSDREHDTAYRRER